MTERIKLVAIICVTVVAIVAIFVLGSISGGIR